MALPSNGLYRFDEFELDRLRRTLVRNGVAVPLSPKTFDVLSCLVMNPGRVVTKEELLQTVWPESFVEESNLTQHISVLRKTLGDSSGYIVTVPGRGYQFAAEVREVLPEVGIAASGVVIHTRKERTRVIMQERYADEAQSHRALPASAPSRRWIWLGAAALLLGLGGWLGWKQLHPPLPSDHHQIVIADFDNRTGEEVFDFVLKNALEIDLEQSPLLSQVGLPQTRSTLQAMGHSSEERLTPAIAREVCERNDAQAYLTGSIVKLGESYVITLGANDCVSGKQLTKLQSQASNRDAILNSLGGLASQMRNKLGESLRSIQGFDIPIQQATTASFDALVAYSRGVQAGAHGLLSAETIPFFERAIQLDPKFAMAYESLGVAEANLSHFEAAKAAFANAYELRQPTSAREQFVITSRFYEVVQNDVEGTVKNFQLWTGSYPMDALVWGGLANTYTQMGRYPEAIDAGRRAVSLQPNATLGYVVLARAYKRDSRFAEAKATCTAARAHGLDSWHLHSVLYQVAVAEHDQAAIAHESSWDKGKSTEGQTLDNSAFTAATDGRLRDAERLFQQAMSVSPDATDGGFSDQVNADLAESQRMLGAFDRARITAEKVHVDADEAAFEAGISAALSGDAAYTRRVIEQQKKAPPSSTLVQKFYVPVLAAAIALRENKPAEAIELLQPAKVYGRRDYYVSSLLGEAYLQSRRPAEAQIEFQNIVTSPGIDPMSPLSPLGHLGLGRAYAMDGKAEQSRKEYEVLFALWKDADADLPVLMQARREYERLSPAH